MGKPAPRQYRKCFRIRPPATYRTYRGIAISFESIGFSPSQEPHPNPPLMKPIISECYWLIVILASPDAYIEGNLVRRRNVLRSALELTPFGTTVVHMETRRWSMLSQDRHKIGPVLRLFQNHFNCSDGPNTFLIGGRTPSQHNQKDGPPHAFEVINRRLAVNVRFPPKTDTKATPPGPARRTSAALRPRKAVRANRI